MLDNSAADASADSIPQPTADFSLKEGKRCIMTYERLVIVANTLMDPVIMMTSTGPPSPGEGPARADAWRPSPRR